MLVLGIIIGWLIELIIDYFYWRKRRICPEIEKELHESVGVLQETNKKLTTGVKRRGFLLKGLEEKLKHQDTALTALNSDIKQRDGDIVTFKKDMSDKENQMTRLVSDLQVRDDELTSFKLSVDDKNKKINELKGKTEEQKNNVYQLTGEAGGSGRHSSKIEALLGERENEITGLQSKLQEQESTTEMFQASLNKKDEELADLKAQLGELVDSLNQQGAEDNERGGFGAGISQGLSAVDAISRLKGQVTEAGSDLESKNVEIKRLKSQIIGLEAGLSTQRGEIEKVKDKNSGLKLEMGSRNTEIQSLKSSAEQHSDNEAQLKLQVVALEDDLEERDSKISSLQANVGENEGRYHKLLVDIKSRDQQVKSLQVHVKKSDSQLVGLHNEQLAVVNELGINEDMPIVDAISHLKGQSAELKTLLSQQDARVISLQGEVKESGAQAKQLHVRLIDKDSELDGIKLKVSSYSAQVDELGTKLVQKTSESQYLQESINVLDDDLKHSSDDFIALEKRLEAKQRELDLLQTEFTSAGSHVAEVESLKAQVVGLEGQLKIQDGEYERVKNKYNGLKLDLGGRKNEILSIKSSVEEHSGNEEQLRLQLSAVENRLEEQEDQVNSLHVSLDKKDKRYSELLSETKSREIQADDLRTAGTDDLTRIWGIGSKLEGVFHKQGIYTFSALGELSTQKITEMLDKAGSNFKLANAEEQGSWVKQAKLAATGEWDEVEAIRQNKAGQNASHNLYKIWGVGSKLRSQLNKKGIKTYAQLAGASVGKIDVEIEAVSSYYLGSDKGEIYHSWITQAKMADNQQWKVLNDYQEKYRKLRRGYDDLKRVWGIGIQVERVLYSAKIYSFELLAKSQVDDMSIIMDKAGDSFNFATKEILSSWKEQARLLSKGDNEALEALQKSLGWDEFLGDK